MIQKVWGSNFDHSWLPSISNQHPTSYSIFLLFLNSNKLYLSFSFFLLFLNSNEPMCFYLSFSFFLLFLNSNELYLSLSFFYSVPLTQSIVFLAFVIWLSVFLSIQSCVRNIFNFLLFSFIPRKVRYDFYFLPHFWSFSKEKNEIIFVCWNKPYVGLIILKLIWNRNS